MTSALITSGKGGSTYGYDKSLSKGALTDETIDPLGNAQIVKLYKNLTILYFVLSGIHPNDGWDELLISSTTFLRTAMTFSNDAVNNETYWFYTFGTTAPFPDTGSNILVRLS